MKKYIGFLIIIGVLALNISLADAYYRPVTPGKSSATLKTVKNPAGNVRVAPVKNNVMLPPPDLIVASIQWTQIYNTSYGTAPVLQSLFPTQPYVYFYVCLQNIGAGPATLSGGQSWHFELYRTPVNASNLIAAYQFQTPVTINPGAFQCFVDTSMWMQPMASNLIFGTTGVKNYTAIVDPNLQVAESNELNNNYTFNMTTNP